MLHDNAAERLAARLGLTLFDLLVLLVVLALLSAIGLTAALGIRETVPKVAFMRADADGLQQLWIASIEDPQSAEQITQAPFGVYDYDVSDDGRYIAYSQRDMTTGVSEIYLLDRRSDRVTQVTNCVMQDADCTAPSFNPNGSLIAYERVLLNNEFSPVGIGVPRVWMIDLTQDPPATFALVENSQILGRSPQWSADGTRLAFYDYAATRIVVYNLTEEGDNVFDFVPTQMGVMGSLSPDGTRMVYPQIGQMRGYLEMADLERDISSPLYDLDLSVDDQQTAWSPDGRYVVIGRRDLSENAARGTQLYLLDTADGVISPLLIDPRYTHGFFTWNADSSRLVMQRFQQLDDLGNPYNEGTLEVWTYNLETRQLTRIAEEARAPQWVGP